MRGAKIAGDEDSKWVKTAALERIPGAPGSPLPSTRESRVCISPDTLTCSVASIQHLSRFGNRSRGSSREVENGLTSMHSRSILIEKDPSMSLAEGRRKRLLVVLFIPSVERDGKTAIDQDHWVDAALDLFGRVFGGATAYLRARGVWRDDEKGGALVRDNPVVLHSYMDPEAIERPESQAQLAAFCRRMGRETNQGEVGLVIDDEYLAISTFGEE